MNQPRTYRRSQLIVDWQFQMKYTGLVVAMGAIISIICAYFIYRAYNENTQLLELHEALGQELARRENTTIVTAVSLFVVLEIVALALWGVLVTHRIAGPVFIISRYVRVLKDGAYPDMRPLRQGDEMKGFFDLFAAMVDNLKQHDQDDVKALDAAIAKLGDDEATGALKKIRERKVKALGEEVSA